MEIQVHTLSKTPNARTGNDEKKTLYVATKNGSYNVYYKRENN